MKRITQIIAMSLLAIICTSQNYQVVNPDNVVYFSPEEEFSTNLWFRPDGPNLYSDLTPVRCLRIDSVENLSNEMVFYNYNEINSAEFNNMHLFSNNLCYFDDKPSWIGEKIVDHNDGATLFFNRNNDTLYLHTQAMLNGSWIFYLLDDQSYFLATVDSWEEMNFLGISDMVKVISLQKYNADNEPISSPLNGTEIWLSENYGFVKCINFRDFPDFGPGTYPVSSHVLIGHSSLPEGFHLLTLGDIYDFDIGDEFHQELHSNVGDYSFSEWRIRKVIGKQNTGNNQLTYDFEDEIWGYTPSPNSNYHYTMYHSPTYSNLDELISQYLPFETYQPDPQTLTYNIGCVNSFNSRPRIITTNDHFQHEIGCILWPYFDSWILHSESYIAGCGKFQTDYILDSSFEEIHHEMLEYFKKGTEEWGTPLVPPSIGIAEHKNQKAWISPNPASDYIQIFTKDDVKSFNLNIMDVSGRQVRSFDNLIPGETIRVSGWTEGMYFYQITTNLFSGTGKIIVKH